MVMKYAVIKTGGKQYKVSEGTVLQVEKLDSDGKTHVFEEVLLVVDGEKLDLGAPTVKDVKVFAEVVAEVKGEKIEVFKFKSKSRYRKHTGHRQKYTSVKITGIGAKPAPVKKAKPKVKSDTVTAKPAGRSVKKAPAKK